MHIFYIRSIYDVCHIFAVDKSVAFWLISKKAPILINTGFCYSSQHGIYHTYYVGIEFVVWEHFLGFICDSFHSQDFLWWFMEEYEPGIWEIIPLFGGYSYHDNAWCIFNIWQYFLFSLSISRIFPRFSFTVSHIVDSPPILIEGDVVKVYLGFLFILFYFPFIIPCSTTLSKHKFIA